VGGIIKGIKKSLTCSNVKLLFLLFFYNVIITFVLNSFCNLFCIIFCKVNCMNSNTVAAQIKMQKIIQNPLQRCTCLIMSYFVEFVHTFDRFFLFY
jgi:hypothetical protein